MCGIFGYFDRSGASLDPSRLDAMGASIAHRGPDDAGIFAIDGAAIGNQRLAILDIEGGHQPFVSADGKVAVVQNGEIYNFVELAKDLAKDGYPCNSHSDTEVLLRLYERDGIGFIDRLNGMFALAILDLRERALYLVRDRVGVKPLYIYDDGRRMLFASEIKSLLAAGIDAALDPLALDLLISHNFVPPPRTAFKDVSHLMPGHILRVDCDSISQRCWWDLPAIAQTATFPEDEWIESFNATLDDAVRLRMRSDVPFGAFLSGGVDSSTVVGLMARHDSRAIRTFSIGFDDPRYDESPFAAEAAERFGTIHVLERVDPQMLGLWPLVTYHCDQPHGDVSFMPTYRLAQLASRHVKVVLTGDGGDELFAGYDKYRDFFRDTPPESLSDHEFLRTYCRRLSLFGDEQKAQLYTTELEKQLTGHDAWAPVDSIFRRSQHLDHINRALMVDMLLLLPGNNLVKPDRMGMAVSLEARTPFLDYRMVELAFQMPGHLKLRRGETKYLYKKAVAPLIGEPLAYRRKQMFTVPVGDWLRNQLAALVEELLLSPRANGRGLFDPSYIRTMVEAHRDGRANYTRQIRALMVIEIWMRTFIDGDLPDLSPWCTSRALVG